MKKLVTTVVALALGLLGAGTAAAQTSEGFDGLAFSGALNSWQCNKVRLPPNATSPSILITGVLSNCSAGSCSNATGDPDLYVYASTATGSAPSSRASGSTCTATAVGTEGTCSVTSGTSDKYYWACTFGYSAFTTIQLRANYSMPNSGQTGGTAQGTVYYMDYWKDNLFLSIAYHRVGCLTGSVSVVSNTDYDGFSNGDYCRNGSAWNSPGIYGTGTTYQLSWSFGSATYSSAVSASNTCNTGANNAYGTANNAYRSTTCSYNIFKNCNSDCWIKNFSNCLDGSGGSGISIASPCW